MPFYFDMFGGYAGDAVAKEIIGGKRPELTRGSIGVNPILFLEPDGEIVGEILATEATTQGLLEKLESMLAEHPEFDRPAAEELAVEDPIERAELLIDLLRDEEADRVLAAVDSPRASYLRGRLARFRCDFDAMKEHFADFGEKSDLADHVRMELAYQLWHEKRYEALVEHLADFPRSSERLTEAVYYRGLALYHAGEPARARSMWKSAIEEHRQDRWIYRMDWAYADSDTGLGKRTPLSRIGPDTESAEHHGGQEEHELGEHGQSVRWGSDPDADSLCRCPGATRLSEWRYLARRSGTTTSSVSEPPNTTHDGSTGSKPGSGRSSIR